MGDSKKKLPKDQLESILAEYRDKLSAYQDFATTCEELLKRLLRREGIRVHSVTCRVKSLESLRAKLTGRETQYDSLSGVTDVAGIRIITYLADDVDAIGTIIEREFRVIPEHSTDKRKALDPDRFGYLSLHYVCALPDRRTRLTEYAAHKGYLCEIQVRSILQHAWAEIEHDLGYKVAEGVPRPIRRRFSRLAGLLELADDEFTRIRDELAEYASDVKSAIAEKPAEVLLDKVSVTTFLEEDSTVRRIDEQLAKWVGAELIEPPGGWTERCVARLRDVGMNTIGDVLAALEQRESVIVRQWEHRLAGQERQTVLRGLSLFHLWQVVLAEKNDPEEMMAALDKHNVHFRPSEDKEETVLKIIEAVREAWAEAPGDAPKRPRDPSATGRAGGKRPRRGASR